jgi:hypothetical protein
MKFQGALVNEQGVKFAIVIVKKTVIDNRTESEKFITSCYPIFPGIPIILMAQDSRGVPTYFGRQDIVKFLANTPIQAIPWREFTIS